MVLDNLEKGKQGKSMEESIRAYFETLEDGSLFLNLDGRFTLAELKDYVEEMEKIKQDLRDRAYAEDIIKQFIPKGNDGKPVKYEKIL